MTPTNRSSDVGPIRRLVHRWPSMLVAAAIVVGGCSSDQDSPDTAAPKTAAVTTPVTEATAHTSDDAPVYPLTIEQPSGPITIEERPERVYVIDSWSYDFVTSLGVIPVGASMYLPPASYVAGGIPLDEIQIIEDELSLEQIAAARPDLIIDASGLFTGVDGPTEQLSEIAPLLEPPGDYLTVGWRERFLHVAKALDLVDEAEALIAESDAQVASVAGTYPQLVGAAVSVGRFDASSSTFDLIIGETDFTRTFLDKDLGFTTPPAQVEALSTGSFESIGGALSGISLERADLVVDGADVTLIFVAGDGTEALTEQAVWQALPAVQQGRIYFIDVVGIFATRTPSPAAIGYFIDTILPELAAIIAS